MQKRLSPLFWLLPLCLQSQDALAWGLYTHVYFAQLLVWAIPLLDPNIQRVVRKFPHLVMAGACLPDLSLVGQSAGTHAFKQTHDWPLVQRMLNCANQNDEERAMALGFISHLLVDVIAHNYFVPAHEAMWVEVPLLTHVVSEWAMDAHLASQIFVTPRTLLTKHGNLLAGFASRHFECTTGQAKDALYQLAYADHFLRKSQIPAVLYHSAKWMDLRLKKRFDYYIGQTGFRLHQINRVLEGELPVWHPEVQCEVSTRRRIQGYTVQQINHRLPLPRDLFQETLDVVVAGYE